MNDIIFGNLKYEDHGAWKGYVLNIYPNTQYFKNLILLNIEPVYQHNVLKFKDLNLQEAIYISTPINPFDIITIQTPLDYTTIQNKHVSNVPDIIAAPVLEHLKDASIQLFKPI